MSKLKHVNRLYMYIIYIYIVAVRWCKNDVYVNIYIYDVCGPIYI